MKALSGKQNLPLFIKLMNKVVEESTLTGTFKSLDTNQLKDLCEEINAAGLKEGKTSRSRLCEYNLMCRETANNPLNISRKKLAVFCEFADVKIEIFEEKVIDTTNKLKLLILKEFHTGTGPFKDGDVTQIIQKRYAELKEIHQLDDLLIELDESGSDSPDTYEEARQMGEDENATMVLWGESHPGEVRIKFMPVHPEKYDLDPNPRGKHKFHRLKRASQLCEGDILHEPDYLLFLLFGLEAYALSEESTEKTVEAIAHFEKLLAFDKDDPEAHFYMGVLHHGIGQLEAAGTHYKSVIQNTRPDDDKNQKASLNLALLFDQTEEFQAALDILNRLEAEECSYKKRVYALQFKVSRQLEEKNLADAALSKWQNEHLLQFQENYDWPGAERRPTESEELIVVRGNLNAFTVASNDPLLDNTLVEIHEQVVSKSGEIDLTLVSLSTHIVYELHLDSDPVELKDSIQRLEELSLLRKDEFFLAYAESNHWVVPESMRIPLPQTPIDPKHLTYSLQIHDKGIIVERPLTFDGTYVWLSNEDLYERIDGSSTAEGGQPEAIQLIGYDSIEDKSLVLFDIPGFRQMEHGLFKNIIRNFQAHFRHLPKDELLEKTTGYFYRQFGIIPEHYFDPETWDQKIN